MQREIAAARAGMYVLRKLLEAGDRKQAVVTVPDLVREITRMMTEGKIAPLSVVAVTRMQQIFGNGGRETCPFCNHTKIVGDREGIRTVRDAVVQDMQCIECEETWTNYYILASQSDY